ncbi:MAG: primosomal protein N' [Burkholderiales bacterium]
MNIVRVGLDVPLAQSFDYLSPGAEHGDIGSRVLVQFGKRTMIGVVLEVWDDSNVPTTRLKHVVQLLRGTPAFSRDDLRLLRFASEYYHYPLGQVVAGALPQRLRQVGKPLSANVEFVLTNAGLQAQVDQLPTRARAQRKFLLACQAQIIVSSADVRRLSAAERKALKAFVAAGWLERRDRVSGTPAQPYTAMPGLPLTPAQEDAVKPLLRALGQFRAFLLCGVTGSGKTEVYLRAAAAAVARGTQVLVLVPEIALTPQLEATIQERFPGVRISSLHSGLNETERLRSWLAAYTGEARIVLGTRLAIFTPLPDLGLIVVDEEHDASFKQSEGFCYSARDLAVTRASQRGVPVVLGSATPSLETYYNAQIGRYTLLELPTRINGRPPSIASIPLRGVHAADGLSPQLLEAVAKRLARGDQTLIFINRRGFAPVLMCHSCGWLSGCHRCSAQLVLHLPVRELHCHHCGYRAPVPKACPDCGNPALAPVGQGTQRVEAALRQHFPQARILRIDRDTTRRKHSWNEMRDRIRSREVDILVGTQILAKGHDFPHLALVGVLNADAMLYSADFRASERLYALLTQVSGRAGRGDAHGEVLIQTEFPEHPLYSALRAQDLARFAQGLLDDRRRAGFPPFVYQALLRAEAAKVESALAFLEHAREIGRVLGGVDLYEAVPASMVRLAGRERAQLLVQSTSRPALHRFLSTWRDLLEKSKSRAARWTLEVDPLEL